VREFLERYRSTIVAFLAVSLPLFLLYVHGRNPGKTTIISHALMQITSPAQSAANGLVGGVIKLGEDYILLVDAKKMNRTLRDDVARLKSTARENIRLKDENTELRKHLQFKRARRDLDIDTTAHVIGKDISPYARVVRIKIDVGAEDTVKEGMAVVTHQGLVGRIREVSGRYAEVLLTVDKDSRVNVKVAGKGVTGTVRGKGTGNEYTANLLYLHKAEPLAVGDTLLTSGHDKVFPPNIPVGYIKSLEERQRGVYYELVVTPAVNYSVLEIVQVVRSERDADAPPRKKLTRPAKKKIGTKPAKPSRAGDNLP
jgi:rod shape-determining protein MreC